VQQALEQCQEFVGGQLHDRQVQGLIMCKLAQLRAMNGEFDEARTMYQQARAMLDDLGSTVNVATTSFDLGMIELLADDPAAAERALRADYDTLVQLGATYLISSMGAILARAVRAQGRDDEALELTRAVETAADDDDVDAQVLWRSIRAPILARAGQLAEAEAMARSAHEKASRTEMPSLRGYALTELASVLQLAARIEEARATLGEATAIYENKGDIVSAARTKRMLAAMERSV
jgi:ATP/maltotriose-dependent transcriptional regulator MalT